MLNLNNIEDLVSYMFDNLDNDEPVSVVADKDLALSIVKELLEYNDVILSYAEVNDYEYDKEYIVTLCDNLDSDFYDVVIEPIYNYEKEMYFGTDGYVLFHEDINSKAMIDMQNNENIELSGYDWFVISENEEFDDSESDDLEHDYMVNGEHVDKDTFNEYISKFATDLVDNDESDNDNYSITVKCNVDVSEALAIIKDMERRMTYIDNLFREMDCFGRLFNWF